MEITYKKTVDGFIATATIKLSKSLLDLEKKVADKSVDVSEDFKAEASKQEKALEGEIGQLILTDLIPEFLTGDHDFFRGLGIWIPKYKKISVLKKSAKAYLKNGDVVIVEKSYTMGLPTLKIQNGNIVHHLYSMGNKKYGHHSKVIL